MSRASSWLTVIINFGLVYCVLIWTNVITRMLIS